MEESEFLGYDLFNGRLVARIRIKSEVTPPTTVAYLSKHDVETRLINLKLYKNPYDVTESVLKNWPKE